MSVEQKGRVAIEVEAARLSPAPSARRIIGWFLQSLDINSASTRYRCYHFATALQSEFESRYFNSLDELAVAAAGLDALIIVKRLDRAVLDVVALAKSHDLPVFLDLCDDLISPAYFKNEDGTNLLHFLGIAPLLSGVTVASSQMAERIEGYTQSYGCTSLSIHVIPDVAETWDVYRETYVAVEGGSPPGDPPPDKRLRVDDIRRIVWFGSYGASHSNFGMFSLMHSFKALRTLHAEIPLELVIVSNSETVYKGLVHECGFPTRYLQWTPNAVYSALAQADIALLTTGDDEFCSIKSSNRALQALASDVPVIAPKGPSLTEFEDVIVSGKILDSLRLCLGPRRLSIKEKRLAAAQPILARYTPAKLAHIWAGLLRKAIAGKPSAPAQSRNTVLFAVEPGDRLSNTMAAVQAAKALPDVDVQLLVSTDLLECAPEFNGILRLLRRTPRFFSGELRGAGNLLLGCSGLVVDRPDAPTAQLLSEHARRLGIPIITSDEAAGGALVRFAVRAAPLAHTAPLAAGPFEEWTKPDGSVDWAFIVHQNARGWILDAICREIGSRQKNSWKVTYHPDLAPDSKNLFFSHYLLLQNYIQRHPEKLESATSFVWYTHPRDDGPAAIAQLLLDFDKVTKVIFTCESNRNSWIERGLSEEKAALVLGAADPQLFRFHARGEGVVGLSSSFYERKDPDRLLQIVKLLPHRQFVLLGRKWNQYALFEELKAQPNFEYRSVPYSEYPAHYQAFDVFLSISSLEGGPIPLLEAMMSNAVPVASQTGFAPDLICHGENGYLFSIDAPAPDVANLIEAAFQLDGDVRETVKRFDWDNFSAAVVELAE